MNPYERIAILAGLGTWLVLAVTIGYVVEHFIVKFW